MKRDSVSNNVGNILGLSFFIDAFIFIYTNYTMALMTLKAFSGLQGFFSLHVEHATNVLL